MTDKEFFSQVKNIYDRVLSMRSNADYVLNKPQMDKLVKVVEFFISQSKDCIDEIDLEPKREHGGVTASFVLVYVHGEDVQKFCDAMSGCSAITIDAMNNEVCISVTVPNVFVHR